MGETDLTAAAGPLPQHGQVWSKVEINLLRLLSRVESRAAQASDHELGCNPKFHTFLAVLRGQLSDLSGDQTFADESRQQPPLIPQDRIDLYRIRIEVLASRISGQVQPDLWQWQPGGASSLGGQHEWREDPGPEELEETSQGLERAAGGHHPPGALGASLSSGMKSPPMLLRRRKRGQVPALQGLLSPDGTSDLAASASLALSEGSTDSVALSSSARALLEQQRDIQEDLTEGMLDLAKQLKANSLAMGAKLKASEALIDDASVVVEGNLASAARAKGRAGDVYQRGWFTGCWTWLVMIMCLMVFMGMILLMKLT